MLILLRHAKSLLNERNSIPEKHNVLSVTGIHQAVEAGIKLQDLGIKQIISSSVPRAYQTAMIISGCLGGLPIEVHDEYAELKTKNPNAVDEWLPEEELRTFENDITICPAFATESQLDVFKRVIPFFQERIADYHKSGPTLLVSHTFVMRALLSYLDTGGSADMPKYFPKNATPMVYQ